MLPINEIFGPTYSGEGADIGRPAIFLRIQSCPVQCPGCDTHYTWDGKEQGVRLNASDIGGHIARIREQFPGCGIVVTGGEPLTFWNEETMHSILARFYSECALTLETSGYHQTYFRDLSAPEQERLELFFRYFRIVHVSPKITPCLHGRYDNEKLTQNIRYLLQLAILMYPRTKFIYKFVVRDMADLESVRAFDNLHLLTNNSVPIYIMPYGTTDAEMLDTSRTLLPWLAKYGYWITPRLQVLLWGRERAH